MRLLLDTHSFLWSILEPDHISRAVRELVADRANEVFISTIVILEIAIKLAVGKLAVRPDLASWVPDALAGFGYQVLPVELEHVMAVERLPLHHRDPFDRLLIAQAQTESLTIVTVDKRFRDYEVPILWA